MRQSVVIIALLGAMLIGQAEKNTAGKDVQLESLSKSIKRFEKIEFIIHLDRLYQNPFNPSEVDLSLEISSPTGNRFTLPAFYYQDFERKLLTRGGRKEEWFYPSGKPQWRARFAPAETGEYSCVARLRDRTGSTLSNTISFESIPSDKRGFVTISHNDPRFLEFSNKKPFFAIGQNLAFLCYGQYLRDTAKIEEVFRKMAMNGANFARIWAGAGDWALAIEWRKSAWGRTWERHPPIVLMPGNPGRLWDKKGVEISGEQGTSLPLSPCAHLALKPKVQYLVSGSVKTTSKTGLEIEVNGKRLKPVPTSKRWTKFSRKFETTEKEWWLSRMVLVLTGSGTAWVTDLSLKEAPDGPELLWEADTNRPVMGNYNLLDSFILDKVVEAAERNGIYLQICLLSNPTRDLYMARLKDKNSPEYAEAIEYAKRIFRYAIARWGYSTAVAVWEYFNEMNPGLPNDRFYDEVGNYLGEIDIYHHLRTTSAWHSNPKDWRHPQLDIANEHFYIRPSAKGGTWKDEVITVLERVKFLRANMPSNRPAMLAEFGLATKDWRQSPYMNRDAKLAHFHNTLWASSLSGLAGTAMFWWWETLDRMNAYDHYKPLSTFLANIPFTRGDLHEAKVTASDQRLRVVGLQGKNCGYLWLFNSQAGWYHSIVEKVTPSEVKDITIEIKGLTPGTYRVRWWNTRRKEVIQEGSSSAKDGLLHLNPPTFLTDIACQIEERASSGRR